MLEATRSAIELIAKTDHTITTENLQAALEILAGQEDGNAIAAGMDRLLSIKKAAELIGVHEKAMWVIVNRENIPVIALGKKCRRIHYSDLKNLMDNGVKHDRRTLPHEWHKAKLEAAENATTTMPTTEARGE